MLLSQMKENEICEIVAVKDRCHIKKQIKRIRNIKRTKNKV